VSTWKILPDGVSWNSPPVVNFQKVMSELEQVLGPPPGRDLDSNGIGLFDAWALQFPCGLEVTLMAFQLGSNGGRITATEPRWIELHANSLDFPHILAHLPFDPGELSPWVPDRRQFPPNRWQVMRQDDNGNVFPVSAFSSRCEAELVAARFEHLGHKQMYWVADLDAKPAN
jgi:hypothetical protein